ncbi:F0F1 ATP synthase subunit epsilon [Ancylobacter pratisalsi]|uniref:ATP synthase epsilon chain n=1 Tax=Ancylobacter pratisalsi TaxID=1745854 RepID=A0A6P1YQT7_9HYPH|nr:F0F1 ATP synthase subunit epsilon [Ancylobacter pratisalsi]QIB35739.1 F0F1 ATP synthase subunit epsilon [Ancylobacter pratisalsi]
MSRTLRLTITTPASVLVDRADVASMRAEDESGGFGILPGHADFLTVLPASVVRWRGAGGQEHFCVVEGGVLTATGGARVAIACRQGTLGDDLGTLEAKVAAMRLADTDADRKARTEQLRLHAHAVRQLMRYLRPGQTATAEAVLGQIQGEEAG